jgi:hypothetical protein
MSDDAELKRHLLGQLAQTHERFADLMETRLKKSEVEEIERYFGLLSNLVAKLEDDQKNLKDVLREMAAEYAAIVLGELSRP